MIELLTSFNGNNTVCAVFCTPALWEYGYVSGLVYVLLRQIYALLDRVRNVPDVALYLSCSLKLQYLAQYCRFWNLA